MKLWIVTARFGQGHFSAAKALEEKYRGQGYEVVISDVMELLYPSFSNGIYRVFNDVICKHSGIYNFLNEFGRNSKKKQSHSRLMQKAFEDIQPDVIITTWSACARMIGSVSVPIYVCITDLGVHEGWIAPHVQGYFVATQDVAEKLIGMGVEKRKIHIQGIPVKKEFRTIRHKSAPMNRILIMGGGLGILPWLDDLLEELQEFPEISVTVIAGNNQKLYRKIKETYPFVCVLGFTNEVPRYLADSDLLVSKPGGVSLFESIYAETPCVAVHPAYKHEIENAAFIQKQAIGDVVWPGEPIGSSVLNLLKNKEACHKYQLNMKKMKRDLQKKQEEGQNVIQKIV